MANFRGQVEAEIPCEDTFDYLADFSNARFWDPGVADATTLTDGPLGEGSAFELCIRTGGRTSPWRYEITDYQRPRLVLLRAAHGPFESIDAISFIPLPGGRSRVDYDARLHLTGAWRVFDPLLGIVFRRIADRGLEGLRTVLAEMAVTP